MFPDKNKKTIEKKRVIEYQQDYLNSDIQMNPVESLSSTHDLNKYHSEGNSHKCKLELGNEKEYYKS